MPTIEPLPAFDLYAELAVPRFADADAIEAAWRAAMRRDHPDVTGTTAATAAATARAARLNVARQWLVDPDRRARYDAVRWPHPVSSTPPPTFSSIDPLGSWPERRRRRTPPTAPAIAAGALMMVLFSILLGPLSSVPAAVLFVFGGLFLFAYGLMAVVTFVVGLREW